MIDLRTIQTFPTDAVLVRQIENLTSVNHALSNSNQVLRNMIIFTAITGGIAITYVIYKKYNATDDDTKRR